MNNYYKTIISCALILIIAPTAPLLSEDYLGTGNHLYSLYLEYKKTEQENPSFYEVGYFVGFVTGVTQASKVVATTFSIPETATIGQMCDVTGKYLEEHPEERHQSATLLVMKALVKAFPIKKDKVGNPGT